MSILTLSITNLGQLRHDVTTRHRFDCKGGTIGSGQASWLNDRNQTIAPIHCEIRWIEGSFCVIDHCHRTYLNDSATSLGALPPRRLLEGDQLRIGVYRLRVQYAQDHASGRSLEDLFNPERRVLDRLIAEQPVNPWPLNPSPLNRQPISARSLNPSWATTPWQRWTQQRVQGDWQKTHCNG